MRKDPTESGGQRVASPPFAAMLREYRVSAGLTQEELAERAGLSARAISNLERGQTSRPFRASAEFLARALALPETDAVKFVAAARGTSPGITDARRRPAEDVRRQFIPDAGERSAEPSGSAEPEDPAAQPPTQLPADISDFTGRDRELRDLCSMLASPDPAGASGVVRVVMIAGAAGLGKTTLAVHAAHRVRDLFPDGQLYADLAGASAEPAAPGEVLGRFLRDLGVDGDKVPPSDEERAALYRTRLSGRRVLVLLDDVKDAAQARPLLPGSSSCAVLTTTRNKTPSVVSTRFIDLETLSGPEALELFSRVIGDDRPAAEPAATREILDACAGLPLAVRVCAARLATRRRWKISTMAGRLRDERSRLDELQLADLEVRAGFQVSYESLKADRQLADPARAFRLLALWPGQKISLPAAAAMTGERETDIATALETLVDTNLLESPEPDWYQFHDLLRLFARELVRAEDSEEERQQAVARLLGWYLRTAQSAAERVAPYRYRPPGDEQEVRYPPSSSVGAALAWYDSERESVITAVRQAAAAGLHDIAWRLPTALFPLFNRRDSWADCITVSRIAMEAAREAGNRPGEAWAMNNLAMALSTIGDQEGLGHAEEALAIRQEIGDRDGEAHSAVSVPDTYYKLLGPEAAFPHSARSLEILREIGQPATLGNALNNHGEICAELGQLDEAAKCFAEALDVWSGSHVYGAGHAHYNLGRVHLKSGRLEDAITSLMEAHRQHVASGYLMGQANTLRQLGVAQHHAGHVEQARKSMIAALELFEELNADIEAEAARYSLG